MIPQPADQAANRKRLGRLGGRPPAFDRDAYKHRNSVERIGLTQQGLMHYFPTKNDLLTAVLELRDQWDVAQVLRTGDSH